MSDETTADMLTRLNVQPKRRRYHYGALWSENGDVSALCFKTPHAIDMRPESNEPWTIQEGGRYVPAVQAGARRTEEEGMTYGRCQCGHSKTSHYLSEGVCEIWKCKCERFRSMVVGDQVTMDESIDRDLARDVVAELHTKRGELWPG